MKTTVAKQSPAYKFIAQAWHAIPGGSWQRINSNMSAAISIAVGGGMKFEKGDMKRISAAFSGGYWLRCEGLYSSACGGERGDYNLSAAMSIEDYFGREPWLWAEDSKTPKRLHVGERFTWKGHYVTITSFYDAKQSLTAVTYKKERDDGVHYHDRAYRRLISERISKDKTLTQKWSPEIKEFDHDESKIAKRFTVTHAELMAVRKQADDKIRKYLKELAKAAGQDAVDAVGKKFFREGSGAFRHFDVETFRKAYVDRGAEIKKAIQDIKDAERREAQEKVWRAREAELSKTHDADLQRWLTGEEMDRHFNVVRLRIKDEFVETSTQQRARVAGVRRALIFVNKYREVGWAENGESYRLDEFPIRRIDAEGVKVGCTFVEWSEVDRISKLLKTA